GKCTTTTPGGCCPRPHPRTARIADLFRLSSVALKLTKPATAPRREHGSGGTGSPAVSATALLLGPGGRCGCPFLHPVPGLRRCNVPSQAVGPRFIPADTEPGPLTAGPRPDRMRQCSRSAPRPPAPSAGATPPTAAPKEVHPCA